MSSYASSPHKKVIDAQAAAIEQAHACIREMEATMEARQVTQNTAKVKPVKPVRQAPVSRERPTNIPIKPLIEGKNSYVIQWQTLMN